MGDRVNREGWIGGSIQAACLVLFVVAAWKPAATGAFVLFGRGVSRPRRIAFSFGGGLRRAHNIRGAHVQPTAFPKASVDPPEVSCKHERYE